MGLSVIDHPPNPPDVDMIRVRGLRLCLPSPPLGGKLLIGRYFLLNCFELDCTVKDIINKENK